MHNSVEKSLMSGKSFCKKIRSLQGHDTSNNQCLVCTTSAPRHICMTFSSFVCERCGDVHREHGHRVCSIQHSEWSSEDFEQIKVGGNLKATNQWLAFWNPIDHPRPIPDDLDGIRDFIRKAFVVKCWQAQPKKPRKQNKCAVAEPKRQNSDEKDGKVTAPEVENDFACFDADWANLPSPPTAAPLDVEVASASISAPASASTASGFVKLPTAQAFYCGEHNSSATRQKTKTSFKACNGCQLQLKTNYCSLVYCPSCSSQLRQCMLCGRGDQARANEIKTPEFNQIGEDSAGVQGDAEIKLKMEPQTVKAKCLSREGSDCHSTEAPPPSSDVNDAGDGSWKADFSSDGEGLREMSPASAPTAPHASHRELVSAPSTIAPLLSENPQPATGSLLDLGFCSPAVEIHAPEVETEVGRKSIPQNQTVPAKDGMTTDLAGLDFDAASDIRPVPCADPAPADGEPSPKGASVVEAAVPQAVSPPSAEEGLKLCEQVLNGDMHAVTSLFKTPAPPAMVNVEVPVTGGSECKSDRYSALDALAAKSSSFSRALNMRTVASSTDFASQHAATFPPVCSRPFQPAWNVQAFEPCPRANSSSFMPDDWMRETGIEQNDIFGDVIDAFHQREQAWEAKT